MLFRSAEGERVILTGAQGRQEVDLVPPLAEAAPPAMPEPVCPAGVVQSELGWEEAAEPAPGTSPLDDALESPQLPPQSATGGDA